jgi:beta-1,2-mannosidase
VTYLTLPAGMGRIAEVACAAARFEPSGRYFLLDFFYVDANKQFRAGQALYSVGNPTHPLAIEKGGSLAWCGLLRYRDAWVVAQGGQPEGPAEYLLLSLPGQAHG